MQKGILCFSQPCGYMEMSVKYSGDTDYDGGNDYWGHYKTYKMYGIERIPFFGTEEDYIKMFIFHGFSLYKTRISSSTLPNYDAAYKEIVFTSEDGVHHCCPK